MSERQLTPVFDGAKDLPIREGWYPSWVKWFGKNKHKSARRYWNGTYFSRPVVCNESDSRAELLKQLPSLYLNSELYWCGLTAPCEP